MKTNEENENKPNAKAPGVSSAEKTVKKMTVKPKVAPEKIDGEERLQKLLSRAGVASRRAAETLIAEGQVSVNGHGIKELGAKADPYLDKITVSGKPLQLSDAAPTVLLLHKPRGYMSTKSDPEGRPIIMDLLPKKLHKLNPVGRLDFDTSGVLLLTDDGDLLHLLTHPSHGVEKVYHARVGGQIQAETVRILETGVHISEGDENSKTKIKTAPCRVRVRAQTEKNALVEVTLREGRNRQVRKMLETMGHAVSSLRRIKFAGFEIEELPPGGYRLLLPGEIHALRKNTTRVIAKKQSRADILKEASAAIEARERRNPRPKTPAKFARPKTGSREEVEETPTRNSRSTLARPIAPSRSTYGTKNKTESSDKTRAPRRVSSYEASGQEKEVSRPYAPRDVSSGSANPRGSDSRNSESRSADSRSAAPRSSESRSSESRSSESRSSESRSSAPRSSSRTTDSRSSAPRVTSRPSIYKPGGEEKPRVASARPSTRPAAYKSASEDKHHDYSTPRDSKSPNAKPRNPPRAGSKAAKPEAPLGERIRRQWKND